MFAPARHARKSFALLLASVVLCTSMLAPVQSARANHDAVIIDGFPSVVQWHNLSCEYAAAAAVTLYWGTLVSQSVFMRMVPQHPNPHYGFRGNIHGTHGGTTDYGIYAEPLVPVLERYGYTADVSYFGGAAGLKSEIDKGFPVVVWITTGRYEERVGWYESYDGERYRLVPYEHAVVVYGYDGDGVYSMDVGSGNFVHTEWDSFMRRWNYFDQMSLIIRP